MSRGIRRATLVAVVVLLAAMAVVGGRLVWGGTGTKVVALFESTIGLYPGSDVQVLGVPVGSVTAVQPKGDVVRVTMELDEDQKVAADTGAVIVAPTLVSDRFVQLTKPWDGGEELASGTVIEQEQTAVPVEIDELYASMMDAAEQLGPNGANRNGAFSELLKVAAENLEGQGADINQMIREFGKATGTLAGTDEALFATIANFKEFNDMLVANDRTVARMNRQFATVADYLAEDRKDLAAAVTNLGEAMAILDDFIRENRQHLKTSVENLIGPTRTLVRQKESLAESVRTIPVLLQNFINAYNPETNTLDGRGNLNELTIWSTNDGLQAQTSADAPPVLLPGVGEER